MLDIPTAFGMLIFFINFKSYGISGQIVSLFSPFLSNRRLEVILDGKSSQEYPVNDGVLKGSVIGHTLLYMILLSMLMKLLMFYTLSVIRHLICGNNLNQLLNLNLIYETLWTWVRSGLLISIAKTASKNNWSFNSFYEVCFS